MGRRKTLLQVQESHSLDGIRSAVSCRKSWGTLGSRTVTKAGGGAPHKDSNSGDQRSSSELNGRSTVETFKNQPRKNQMGAHST